MPKLLSRSGWRFWLISPILAAATVGASFAVGWMARDFRRLPEIAATLTGNETDFSQEITERIQRLFPIGSDEERLIDFLGAQGFAPEWRRRDMPNAGRFVREGLLCAKTVRISWRADTEGKLTEASGDYSSRCF
jgi:hypothetical protein